MGHVRDDGRVQGTIEPSVAAAVESVADGVARRCGDRVDASQDGERRFGANTASV